MEKSIYHICGLVLALYVIPLLFLENVNTYPIILGVIFGYYFCFIFNSKK